MGMWEDRIVADSKRNIVYAVEFYFNEIDKYEPDNILRHEYLRVIRHIIDSYPKHSRHDEFYAKLKTYEKAE